MHHIKIMTDVDNYGKRTMKKYNYKDTVLAPTLMDDNTVYVADI